MVFDKEYRQRRREMLSLHGKLNRLFKLLLGERMKAELIIATIPRYYF